MENEPSIEGMPLDEYMEKCITYNNKLQISGPDESLLYTPSESSRPESSITNESGDSDDYSKVKLLSLSNSERTEPSVVSTSLLKNCGESSSLLQSKNTFAC